MMSQATARRAVMFEFRQDLVVLPMWRYEMRFQRPDRQR